MGCSARKRVALATVAAALAWTAAAAADETKAECQDRWLKAEAAGIAYGEAMIDGMPTVAIDEDTFVKLDFDRKARLAEVFECATAGPGVHYRELHFISNMTHKVLAIMRAGTLEVQ